MEDNELDLSQLRQRIDQLDHEIARLPVFDHIPDRLFTVCNLNESAFCFPDSRPDIVQNRLWFLIPRIV